MVSKSWFSLQHFEYNIILRKLKNAIEGNFLTPRDIQNSPVLDLRIFYDKNSSLIDKMFEQKLLNSIRSSIPLVIWVFGPTGIGKSRLIRDFIFRQKWSSFTVTPSELWWDNYYQQTAVVFEEFSGLFDLQFLLGLFDKSSFPVKRRNKKPIPFTSPLIFLNSAQPPEFYFVKNILRGQDIQQLFRRIHCFKLVEYLPVSEIEDRSLFLDQNPFSDIVWSHILDHPLISNPPLSCSVSQIITRFNSLLPPGNPLLSFDWNLLRLTKHSFNRSSFITKITKMDVNENSSSKVSSKLFKMRTSVSSSSVLISRIKARTSASSRRLRFLR